MNRSFVFIISLLLAAYGYGENRSWSADNGNGTYTNPLTYDEFSDPDVIRVGDDYYLAGTTMHTVPGLVILHSKDLVNWENVSYCFDRFPFDDDTFSLKNGKEIYGQGIWAPCIRYNDGKFYLYSNVNGKGLQCFTSDRIEGSWKHINMKGNIYDLGVLFDDDGKVYAIHGYGEVRCTELKPDMSGPVEGSERVIIPEGNGVGEGHHMYKINDMYYLISTDYIPNGRTLCSRSKSIWGPYERSDSFDGKALQRVWQWNHNPDDRMWSLTNGKLRLKTMPADQLMWARNTLTQRAIGPVSTVTVELDANHLKDGDVCGLGNINVPCSWIGVVKDGKNLTLRRFEQLNNDTTDIPLASGDGRLWLRLTGDYDNDKARYSYSLDGTDFKDLGGDMTLSYQLITFQGARPSLFAFNKNGKNGGYAEFDNFTVDEPKADRSGYIPFDRKIRIINLATDLPMHATTLGVVHDTKAGDMSKQSQFRVIDRGNGKVVLKCEDGRYVSTSGFGLPGDVRMTDDISLAEEFMWQDFLDRQFMLLSMKNHKYVGKSPTTGSPYSMDYPGSDPARRNGAVFRWEEVKE